MSQKPYQREQGDFELRILKDGRLVMIAPDETLLEIAQAVKLCHCEERSDEAISTPSAGDCFAPLAMTYRPGKKADSEPQHLESHDAETPTPGGE
jgi:hypothetical protein